MKYHCIENTYDYDYADWNIRLWISTNEVTAPKHDYSETIAKIVDESKDTRDVVRRLSKLENINAIQVRDRYKQAGVMVYTVPF